MTRTILLLGGTSEASALAAALAARGERAVLSYAGRVAAPRAQPVPTRTGGFGGVPGLVAWLRRERVTHLIDATHPFAAQMSRHAAEAAAEAGVQLLALVRPPWRPGPGDDWTEAPDLAAAAALLAGPPQRVFLAIGRLHLAAFATQPQHDYLLRLVDPPDGPLPLPGATIVVDRGPFTADGDAALLRAHRIGRIVAKNAGGEGAESKLVAARRLGLPVTLIARPPAPARREASSVAEVLAWLGDERADAAAGGTGRRHGITERGV